MEIKTKFNVNEFIYPITYAIDEWIYGDMVRIIAIKITDKGVFYVTPFSKGLEEKDCFWTLKEAQKECDRRNGKE
jgi:hypothetical protein